MTDVDDFVTSGGAPPAHKFEAVGTTVEGDITKAQVLAQRKFGSDEIDTWPDGTPKKQLVIDLRLDDGEETRLYCKPALKTAIQEAVEDTDGRLSDGGRLKVRRTEDAPSQTAGFAPRHTFKAKFTPAAPVAAGDIDELDDF